MPLWITLLRSLRTLRAADRQRPGVPGEHWAAFGAALTALSAARRVRSPMLRTLALAAGGVLALRAVTGRDGALAAAQRAARRFGTNDRRR